MGNESGLQIVEIEITNRCNLNCKHCYVDKSKPRDLDKDKVYSLIDELSNLKVYRLVFTGGEPLISSEIFNFINYAKDKKIPEVAIMTNGLLIDKENIQKLKRLDLIQLSLDSAPGENPKFRENYFFSLKEKIKQLKKEKIKVTLQATLHRELIKNLNKLSEFAKEMDVSIGINRLVPIGEAKSLTNEILSKPELMESFKKIVEVKNKEISIRCTDPLIFLMDKKKLNFFKSLPSKNILEGCIAGICTFYINVDGDVYPCPFLRSSVANVFDESLKDIWTSNKIFIKLRNRNNLLGKCGKCEYRAFCGGCRGSALREHNSIFESDPNCFSNLI
jgi:radical SAM protein with 4Fe4S-binding SPASM domain